MSFQTVFILTAVILIVPTIAGAVIGFFAGSLTFPIVGSVAGWVWGLAAGAFGGVNALGLFLFLLGLGATPFGSVIPGEAVAAPVTWTYHFGHNRTGFPGYSVGPLNPANLNPASGGLTPIIVNGAPAAGAAVGPAVTAIYTALMFNPGPLVVWGLLPFDLTENPEIRDAIALQLENYEGKEPTHGLLLVVGTTAWSNAETLAMISAGVKQATAADGSLSAMMGCESVWVIGDPSLFNLGSYRDPIQRYGFKAAS
jgi:hypothetical protein